MLTVKDLIKLFGVSLNDPNFQIFLKVNFSDLTNYDPSQGDYIISEKSGIELGFTNNTAVFDEDGMTVFEPGNPVFSHFNLFPKSEEYIFEFPLGAKFSDRRKDLVYRSGQPTKTNSGYSSHLEKEFLIDHYKIGDIVISIDYDSHTEEIKHIQIRDNNIVEHLRI